MSENCYSCGAPLAMPEFKGPAEDYCKHCSDEEGNLKSFEEVRMGTAFWLKSWQPDIDEQKAVERAGHYLKAMPAWAE
jgi:Putative zinc ribbon domain